MHTHTSSVELTRANHVAHQQLHRRWLGVALSYGAVYLAGYVLLVTLGDYPHPGNWLLWAAVCMVVVLGIVRWILPHNHPPRTPRLYPTLGYGTGLTLVCGALLFLLAGFLFAPRPSGLLAWLPALLYTVARLVDYFDGYVARITNHESKLGEILDIELDGLGMLIAITIAIQYGQLPLWYFPLGLARQLFIGGIWLRQRRNLPVHDLPPSDNRRITAGYQTGFVCVILWPVFEPPLTTLAAALFAAPLLAGFVRDWLVVSDQIDPQSPTYLRLRRATKALLEMWLPPVARIVGSLLAASLLWQALPALTIWRAGLDSAALAWLFAISFCLALPLFLLGVLGRVAALFMIGLACLDSVLTGLNWQNGLLLGAAFVVAHFGAGRFALWSPEEAILHQRQGKPNAPPPTKPADSSTPTDIAPRCEDSNRPGGDNGFCWRWRWRCCGGRWRQSPQQTCGRCCASCSRAKS
ncbi:MAG: CDP-alcohol phosphatidyltransferase family protein [Litorilinea sp.]